MTMDDALLPCPFCGGEAQHYHRPDTTGWSNTDWVSCSDDDCGVSTALEETKAEAIAAWNRRAGQSHDAGLLAALEVAERAINEYYRYMTGGETRGSYDGKPERQGLWDARLKALDIIAAEIVAEAVAIKNQR